MGSFATVNIFNSNNSATVTHVFTILAIGSGILGLTSAIILLLTNIIQNIKERNAQSLARENTNTFSSYLRTTRNHGFNFVPLARIISVQNSLTTLSETEETGDSDDELLIPLKINT